jgi:8-oxo-dGTP pyrophosphatase MutT (NUDIX family)
MPHIHDKIDFTVEVFIVNKNKVLLRKHDKYKIWLSVGGHIELDEDPNQAAIREVKEEVGLDIILYNKIIPNNINNPNFKDLIPPIFLNRHRVNSNHEHVTLVYFAKSSDDRLVLSESEKSEDCRWFSMDDLDNPIFGVEPKVKEYAKTALDSLKE